VLLVLVALRYSRSKKICADGLLAVFLSLLSTLDAKCVGLFMVSCEEINKRYMLSQPHPDRFNIEACWACDKIRLSHIETGAEKQCNKPAEHVYFADLWHP
jgi:hypothetical protein